MMKTSTLIETRHYHNSIRALQGKTKQEITMANKRSFQRSYVICPSCFQLSGCPIIWLGKAHLGKPGTGIESLVQITSSGCKSQNTQRKLLQKGKPKY